VRVRTWEFLLCAPLLAFLAQSFVLRNHTAVGECGTYNKRPAKPAWRSLTRSKFMQGSFSQGARTDPTYRRIRSPLQPPLAPFCLDYHCRFHHPETHQTLFAYFGDTTLGSPGGSVGRSDGPKRIVRKDGLKSDAIVVTFARTHDSPRGKASNHLHQMCGDRLAVSGSC
jgi:hypothetical protein